MLSQVSSTKTSFRRPRAILVFSSFTHPSWLTSFDPSEPRAPLAVPRQPQVPVTASHESLLSQELTVSFPYLSYEWSRWNVPNHLCISIHRETEVKAFSMVPRTITNQETYLSMAIWITVRRIALYIAYITDYVWKSVIIIRAQSLTTRMIVRSILCRYGAYWQLHLPVMRELLEITIPGAAFDSSARDPPPRCHPGTRLTILERCLYFLVKCSDRKKTRWVVGATEIGKSDIMQSVAEHPFASMPLHASIFFFFVNRRSDRNTRLSAGRAVRSLSSVHQTRDRPRSILKNRITQCQRRYVDN
jgi:hypothetical protein